MQGCSLLHPGQISCMIDPWLLSSRHPCKQIRAATEPARKVLIIRPIHVSCEAAAAHHLEIWSLPSLQKHVWKGSVGRHNDVMPALHYSFDMWQTWKEAKKDSIFWCTVFFIPSLSLGLAVAVLQQRCLSGQKKAVHSSCSSSAAFTCCSGR